jgi:hypothetical protein
MRISREIWVGAMALCLAMPAVAATSTPYAKGGRTKDFAVDVEQYRRSGEPFRITGHCQSACTMFLALRNVCVEPHDQLLQREIAQLSCRKSCHGKPGVPHHIGPRHDQPVWLSLLPGK